MPIKKPDEEVVIGYDGGPLKRGLRNARSRIKSFASFTKALVAAAAIAMARAAVKAFAIQEQAEIRLRRALEATGQYSKQAEKNLKDVATQIQANTKIGDEQALGFMAQLIQIGKVAPEQVGSAVEAIAGLAEITGKSVSRVARNFSEQIARATMAGASSLGEYEIYLDDVQKKEIRHLANIGKSAEANALYVSALHGYAAGQSKVIEGSTQEWVQLGNAWGDFIEMIGQFVHELLVGLIPTLKEVLKELESWGPTLRLIGHVTVNFFALLYNNIALTINSLRALPTAVQLAFATAFEQAINIVVRGINYLLSQVPDWFPGGGKRIKPVDFTSELEKQLEVAAGRVKKYSGRMQNNLSEIWRGFTDGDAVLAEKDLPEGKNQEKVDSGPAGPTQDLDKLQNEIDQLKGAHDKLLKAEADYSKAMLTVAADREAARLLILNNGNLEEARLLQERADALEQNAIAALEKEKEAAAIKAAEAQLELELEAEARELAKELGILHAEEDLEFLKEGLRAEHEAKHGAREKEIADRITAHRKQQADEKIHGKRMAGILKFSRSKELGIGKNFLDTMIGLNVGGSKKLQKIQELSERARLLLMLGTKPFEAYAETSSRYPAPLGPALGALHAAAVVAQIGAGLRAVGGGGGGSAGTGGDLGGPVGDDPDAGGVGIAEEEDSEEPKKQVINLTVNLEADGFSIARLVEQQRVQAEDE